MKQIEEIYNALQKAAEKSINREMVSPRDFDYMSVRIYERTGEIVSSMTLKRFWGYLGDKNKRQPRLSTLGILSSLIGYTNWASFYNDYNNVEGKIQSDFLLKRTQHASAIPNGTLIRLRWEPNRCVTIRHEGYEVFTVLESINSKLSAGDTFRCGLFIDNEPAYLSGVVHDGKTYDSFVCGSDTGIKFDIIK